MSPVWMFEGERELDPVSERNLVERRLAALAAAVHEHEARVRKQLPGMRSMRRRAVSAAAAHRLGRADGPARARGLERRCLVASDPGRPG